jgi:hypothetical protein
VSGYDEAWILAIEVCLGSSAADSVERSSGTMVMISSSWDDCKMGEGSHPSLSWRTPCILVVSSRTTSLTDSDVEVR